MIIHEAEGEGKMKVLLVDDDIMVCRGLKQLIPWENLGATIVGDARNGLDAYRLALRESPDLIISDVKMPQMDGIELSKRVFDSLLDTKIILLSAYEDFNYAKRAIEYGVDSYILKPIDKSKLQELLERIRVIKTMIHDRHQEICTIMDEEYLKVPVYEAIRSYDEGYFRQLFADLPIQYNGDAIKVICVKLIHILFDYFKHIGFSLENYEGSKEKAIEDILILKQSESIISYTYEMYLDILQFNKENKSVDTHISIVQAKRYIKEHMKDFNLSVAGLAEHMGITSSYLSIFFRKETGVNVSSYITITRIEKACYLLKTTGSKISIIATEVGYTDYRYFTKVFKKKIGLTPSQYRELHGEGMLANDS